jgi:hypothetical protein
MATDFASASPGQFFTFLTEADENELMAQVNHDADELDSLVHDRLDRHRWQRKTESYASGVKGFVLHLASWDADPESDDECPWHTVTERFDAERDCLRRHIVTEDSIPSELSERVSYAEGFQDCGLALRQQWCKIEDVLAGDGEGVAWSIMLEQWRQWTEHSAELAELPSMPKSIERKCELLQLSHKRKFYSEFRKPMEHEEKAFRQRETQTLYGVPGLIRSVMSLSMETARYPNSTLAFCGALSLMSLLVGRRVTYRGLAPNLYLMALASSGSGKDQARKVNVHLLQEAGLGGCLGDSIASGQGLEEALFQSPQMLLQLDELDSLVRAMAGHREERFESIADRLLRFFTSSNSTFYLRRKADDQEARYITHPHLVLYGTCTPQGLYDAISRPMLTNGLFARLLIVEADKRGKRQIAKPIESDPSILQEIEHWKQFGCEGENLASRNPKVLELPEEDDARDALEQACDRWDAAYERCEASKDECSMSLWARAGEQATRLAALYACSANALEPCVTLEAIRWATRFVDVHLARMLQAADEMVAESPFAKTLAKLHKAIRESSSGVDHSKLLKDSHLKSREFAEAIGTLMERGQVACAVVNGRKRYVVTNL